MSIRVFVRNIFVIASLAASSGQGAEQLISTSVCSAAFKGASRLAFESLAATNRQHQETMAAELAELEDLTDEDHLRMEGYEIRTEILEHYIDLNRHQLIQTVQFRAFQVLSGLPKPNYVQSQRLPPVVLPQDQHLLPFAIDPLMGSAMAKEGTAEEIKMMNYRFGPQADINHILRMATHMVLDHHLSSPLTQIVTVNEESANGKISSARVSADELTIVNRQRSEQQDATVSTFDTEGPIIVYATIYPPTSVASLDLFKRANMIRTDYETRGAWMPIKWHTPHINWLGRVDKTSITEFIKHNLAFDEIRGSVPPPTLNFTNHLSYYIVPGEKGPLMRTEGFSLEVFEAILTMTFPPSQYDMHKVIDTGDDLTITEKWHVISRTDRLQEFYVVFRDIWQ